MERSILEDKCERALFAMGQEKSLGWDGITIKFFREFWPKLCEVTSLIANRAFLQGEVEKCILSGLTKPIPKQISCSLLKHWQPITMMPVIYKIAAKVVAFRLSQVFDKVIISH